MSVTPLPYHPTAALPAVPGPDRVASVIELIPAYWDLAERVAATEFVPKDLRRRPEAVLAALLSGAERGLGPMESLRSINVIEGKPSLSAEAMRALVLAAGHEIEIIESNANKATLVGRRAGSTTTSPPFTWTIDRARRANLTNKDNWRKYPEAMLLARASTDLCRAVFPDVIAGLASTEEVDDTVPVAVATTTKRAPARRGPAVATAAPAAELPTATSAVATPQEMLHTAPAEPALVPDAVLGGIPGSDRPSWGAPPPPAKAAPPKPDAPRPHDPKLAKRIHAEITKAFPDTTPGTRDRWRHALVAAVTRKRPTGPTTSSTDLDMEEQLVLSEALTRIIGGSANVTDGPDGVIEIAAGNGWRYSVTLDPLNVTSMRPGTTDPELDDTEHTDDDRQADDVIDAELAGDDQQ